MRPLFGLPLVVLALLVALPVASAQDVTSDHFGTGESFSHTFGAEGKARFHCHPHPGMGFGDIQVGPASADGPTTHVIDIVSTADGFAFSDADLEIAAGDTVEWSAAEGTHQIMIWLGSATGHTGDDGHGDHAHDDHAHDDGHDTHESPAPLLFVPLAAMLGLAAWRRR